MSQGARLPNGDLLVCDGNTVLRRNDSYMLFKQGSNQWKKVGTVKRERWLHSSVYFNGCLITVGGLDSQNNAISHHEQGVFEEGVNDRKELPIALYGHTTTLFDHHKMLICGGRDIQVGKFYISHEDKKLT